VHPTKSVIVYIKGFSCSKKSHQIETSHGITTANITTKTHILALVKKRSKLSRRMKEMKQCCFVLLPVSRCKMRQQVLRSSTQESRLCRTSSVRSSSMRWIDRPSFVRKHLRPPSSRSASTLHHTKVS
jgi:hypothetical protein